MNHFLAGYTATGVNAGRIFFSSTSPLSDLLIIAVEERVEKEFHGVVVTNISPITTLLGEARDNVIEPATE